MARPKQMLAACLVCVLATAGIAAAADKPDLVIADFENGMGPIKGEGKIVQKNASQGKSSLKVEHPGDVYTGFSIEDKAILAKFKEYAVFKVDIFNPQDKAIQFGVRIDDATSKDFGSRFNDERGTTAPPGWSTYELNLSGMRKSNSKNFAQQEKVDMNTLKIFKLSVGPKVPACVLYFDNIRLEASNLPGVEGLRAFDVGPSKSDVYPGFEACSEQNTWGKDSDFGWVRPQGFDNAYMPDSLGGDYGSGDEFKLKLPNGKHEVHLCMDPFGIWNAYPRFSSRQLVINGKTVLDQKMTPQEFLDKCYFLHEDDEDLPGQDLWNKYVLPRNVPRYFQVEVTDGVLSIKINCDLKYGKYMQYLIVYPTAKKDEGDKWMAALEKKRHDSFNKKMAVVLPPQTGKVPTPSEAEKSAGFIAFSANAEEYVYVNTVPGESARAPLSIEGAKGERLGVQLGLYPIKEVKGMTVSVSDLTGPGGAKIASSNVSLRKVRNFLKREHRTTVGDLLPYLLQQFQTLDLQPGVTRAIWISATVPTDAAPGEYAGAVTFSVGGKDMPSVPVKLKVYPFALDKVKDITFSATGGRSSIPEYLKNELNEEWWKRAEGVMKDLADHGMNAVCGGPAAMLKGIKDGKADIDFTDMDEWMALANKYGLTMPGDSYQGFDVNTGVPNNAKKDAVAALEAAAKKKTGVSYEVMIRIVYAEVEKHAKEKNWPVRSYYFLDEPRPEFGNIESSLELIKIRTKAAPNTRFSGYYSTGQGRDDYFKYMPVSISHVNKDSLALTKGSGKELWVYDGSRQRYASGRWSYAAARAGIKGYLTNGYLYVTSEPYFDFTDDEASWCVAYPSKNGVTDCVPWERVAEGVNDYRYLSTLQRLIDKAKADKKAPAEAAAAEKFMKETLGTIDIDKMTSAALSPQQYCQFRKTLADNIIALGRALGEIK